MTYDHQRVYWEDPVETHADLPEEESDGVGRYVKDTGDWYIYCKDSGWLKFSSDTGPIAFDKLKPLEEKP